MISGRFGLGLDRVGFGFAGADRLVAGSDYPHQIGSLAQMVSSIGEMDVSDDERAKIFGGNAARILGLDQSE